MSWENETILKDGDLIWIRTIWLFFFLKKKSKKDHP